PLVLDALGDLAHQFVMIDSIEEFFQIKINHPTVALRKVLLRLCHGLMCRSMRSKPIAVMGERRVPPLLQNLHDRLLDEAIQHGWHDHIELHFGPVGLWVYLIRSGEHAKCFVRSPAQTAPPADPWSAPHPAARAWFTDRRADTNTCRIGGASVAGSSIFRDRPGTSDRDRAVGQREDGEYSHVPTNTCRIGGASVSGSYIFRDRPGTSDRDRAVGQR